MEAIFLIVLFLYFIPSLIAGIRRKKNTTAITVLNAFFGWTFVGWVVALIWALMVDRD